MSLSSQRRDLIVRIDAETKNFEGSMQKSSAELRGFKSELKKLEAQQAKQHKAMGDLGKVSVAAGAAAAAGMALASRAAINWSSDLAGVAKTLDTTGLNSKQAAAALGELEGDLRDLAKTLPVTHSELAGIAEAAGQLGVQRDKIVDFTRVVVALGQTTDLSYDEAATSLAQFANVMKISQDDFGRVGAALVDLGNNGASTESQIMALAQRLSGAGSLVGAAPDEVLALASAMADLGIEAELGGGAMSRTLTAMYAAVQEGGERLDAFAATAGMSGQALQQAFGEGPIQALDAVVRGLAQTREEGGNVVGALADMGLKGTQNQQVLLRLTGAGDGLTKSLERSADAYQAQTALMKEAEVRYDTVESKIKMAKNSLNDLAIGIGTTLLPAIGGAAGMVGDFADLLGRAPGPVKTLLAVVGTLGATFGIVGGAALIAVPKIAAFRLGLETLSITAPRTAAALGSVGGGMARIGAAAGAAAALAGVALAVGQVLDAIGDDPGERMGALTDSLVDFANNGRVAGELARIVGDDFELFAEKIDRAGKNRALEFLNPFGDADVLAIGEAQRQIEALDQALAGLVQNGNAATASRLLAESGLSAQAAADAFPTYTDALAGTSAQSKLAADGIKGVGGAAAEAAPELEKMTDAQKALESALSSFINPLGVYQDMVRKSAEHTAEHTKDSKDSWQDYVDSTVISLDKLADRLEQDIQDQANWEANLVKVAQSYGAEVAQILAEMGEEGVGITAQMADGISAEGQRVADGLIASASAGGEGAARALDAKLKVMALIAQSGGKATVDSIAAQLQLGTGQVAEIARQYGVELAAGINPILASIGGRTVNLNQKAGRGYTGPTAFDKGGFHEDHTAQIAPAGAWRVWAEDETGGEAYIPLAPSKRPRSRDIWRETGRRLGVDFAEFEVGGFWSPEDVPRPPGTSPFRPPISTAADATMAHAYGEAVEWVKANAAPPLSSGIGYRAMMAALHVRFPGLALLSGLRPGAITATGNPSYHGMGRAVDLPPSLEVNRWIAQHYAAQTRELILSLPGAVNLRNGQPHRYGEPTFSMHQDHNHWALAKGGILNPHVRDVGGPLRPGYTFNGTGRSEMVLPMATGGTVWTGPTTGGSGSLSQVAAGIGNVTDLRALLEAWDRHLDQLEQAARRHELLVAVQNKEAGAMERLRDFDVAAYRDAERDAVEAQIDAIERSTRATEEDYRRRVEINNNLFEAGKISLADHLSNLDRRIAREVEYTDEWKRLVEQRADAERADYDRRVERNNAMFELGELTVEQHLGNLDRRMAKEERYSPRWMALHRQRKQVVEDVARAEQEAADKVKRAHEDALAAAEKAADRLNRLLDERAAIQGRMAQSSQRHAERQAGLEQRRQQDSVRFAEQQRALLQRQEETETAHFARLTAARRDFATSQAQLVAARRDALAGATAADQLTDFRRGLPAGWLIGNVRRQVQDLREWMRQLDLAREMGVSDAVIEALGLDEGPQALHQVKALTSATKAEIDDLNGAVEARTRVAGQQARREQARNLGELGRSLTRAQQEYAASVQQIQADYRNAQEQIAADMLAVQREYREAQQRLSDELALMQQEFLAEQRSLSADLAAVGADQGRSLAEAIAEGIRSGIPAIVDAAREAQEAARGATGSGSVNDPRLKNPVRDGARTGGIGHFPGVSRPGVLTPGRRQTPQLTFRPDGTFSLYSLPPVQSSTRTVTFHNTFQVKDPADYELVLRQQAFQASSGAL
jgi:TP901 family phage tail tape measure protein